MLSTVLGGGMSSRLFLEVRERRGLAYYVHGMNHSYTDAGSLLAQAGVDIKRIDEAIKVIVEQFAAWPTRPSRPTSSRRRARSRRAASCSSTESPQGLIMFGLNREVLEGKALEPEELLAKLDAVTAEDVQRVAQDLIANDKLHLAVIGPFDDDERFASCSLGVAVAAARRGAPSHEEVVGFGLVHRTPAPAEHRSSRQKFSLASSRGNGIVTRRDRIE